MIVNGSLYYLVSGGIELDSDGDPISVTPVWSSAIPCQLVPIRNSNKGKYEDGQFSQSSYEIIIMPMDFTAKTVSLVDNNEGALGEYRVQDIEFLDVVKRVKITV